MATIRVLNTTDIEQVLTAAQESSEAASAAAAAALSAAQAANNAAAQASTEAGQLGPQGPPGPTLTYKGEWQPGEYARFDQVHFAGSSYYATAAVEAEDPPPSDPWTLLAAAGKGLEGAIGGISERVSEVTLSETARPDLGEANNFDVTVDKAVPVVFAGYGAGSVTTFTVAFVFRAGVNIPPSFKDPIIWLTENGGAPPWSVGQDRLDLILFFTRRGKLYGKPLHLGLAAPSSLALPTGG